MYSVFIYLFFEFFKLNIYYSMYFIKIMRLMWKNIFYEMSVSFFIFRLEAIYVLISNTHSEAIEKWISEWDMLDMKLDPNMDSLVFHTRKACETAKSCVANLTWKKAPIYIDEESTVWELLVRLRKTIDYLETFVELDFEESEKRKIESEYQGKFFSSQWYLKNYAIPYFMFHDVSIYNILKVDGFEINENDFLHSLPLI